MIFPSNLFKKGYTLISRRFYSSLPSDDYSSFFLLFFFLKSPLQNHFYVSIYLCVSLIRLKNFHFAGEKERKERREKKGSKSDSPIRWIFFIFFLFLLFRERKHRIIALLATCIFCPINSLEFYPFKDTKWTRCYYAFSHKYSSFKIL